MRTSIEHIMMLDDEDDHHFITRLMLKKAGWEGRFSSFTNADAAVAYLSTATERPDLLLVDINMPVANGFDFLTTCEKERLLPSTDTTVIMCSSSNRPVDIHLASRLKSVSGYIEKPLAVEHFERIAWQHGERKRTALPDSQTLQALLVMKKILIVEDETIISFGYRLQLEQMGFEVMASARSSEEAEEALKEEYPDVIIMDVYLKGEKTGLELAREIQAKRDIPIIFLTASTKPEVVQGIRELQGCHYLTKPIDSDNLTGLLHGILRKNVA